MKKFLEMKLGYLQQLIVEMGIRNGKVTNYDVNKLYPSGMIQIIMNKLVALGYFEPVEDKVTYVEWKYKEHDSKKH